MNAVQLRERIDELIDRTKSARFTDKQYYNAINGAITKIVKDRIAPIRVPRKYSVQSAQRVRDELYTLIPAPLTGSIADVAIVSSTNATPIVINTATSVWTVGQLVTIESHTVNTNANGTWVVSATNGTTTITLTGSAGNGVGGATGTVGTETVRRPSDYFYYLLLYVQ